jgi:hypothetical protein
VVFVLDFRDISEIYFRFPRYFNLAHSKVGNVNINRTSLTFFVFDPVDAMYAFGLPLTKHLFLYFLVYNYSLI